MFDVRHEAAGAARTADLEDRIGTGSLRCSQRGVQPGRGVERAQGVLEEFFVLVGGVMVRYLLRSRKRNNKQE